MMSIPNNRIARAARFLAARLESESEIHLSIPSDFADSRIFRIMLYLNHYFGKYWIEYPDQNHAIIRKQG